VYSTIYLAEATNFGVIYLDRLESRLWPQSTEGIQQDWIQFQHGRSLADLGKGGRFFFLMTSYQNFRLCEQNKPLDLRDLPKLTNQAFPWGVSERAYVIVNIQGVTGGRDKTIPKNPKTPISKVERFGR
jgi:hypothetical protein